MDTFFYALEKSLTVLANKIHSLRLSFRKPTSHFEKLIKLNLGSGGIKKAGFIGIDAILGPGVDVKHNLEEGIPFPDNSVSEIYSSHLLEHLAHQKVPNLLKECYRVMKPRGKIIIEVPDLDKTLQVFLRASEERKWDSLWEWIFGNQKKEFEFHKTGFTKKRLEALLKRAGFKQIIISTYKHGPIPSLQAKAVKHL